MNTDYEEIAVYEGDDLIAAVKRLAENEEFTVWLKKHSGKTISPFQKTLLLTTMRMSKDPLRVLDNKIVFPFLEALIRKTTDGVYLSGGENIPSAGAFFMSNHRDIILDAALLSYELKTSYDIRPYLGVGNNLFAAEWIEDLMRVCKCFTVIRNGAPKEVMAHAELLSRYISAKRSEGGSFWLAQREGRAKDGNDRTQPAVLKMLTLAKSANTSAGGAQETIGDDFISRLKRLNITPVAITYDIDPCDYLKAREMQLKRDDITWHKTPEDDMLNMKTGLFTPKGQVHLVITPCINDELDYIAAETDVRNEQIRRAAELIDRHIHSAYYLSPFNRAAAALATGNRDLANDDEIHSFEHYITRQINRIEIPDGGRDIPFLRNCLITMYANPALNKRVFEK
ncbi:MAG: 1-acyl-sn-glycerol-3-phosphate acyltransferase [Paludibacteraceae bacterium]|nr:1-acyl-sn-glycerol-3-phosphate acyltransferase [Paludibacteraceae bacterium]